MKRHQRGKCDIFSRSPAPGIPTERGIEVVEFVRVRRDARPGVEKSLRNSWSRGICMSQFWWRAHSCVLRRHSCRRSEVSRKSRGDKSVAAARKSAGSPRQAGHATKRLTHFPQRPEIPGRAQKVLSCFFMRAPRRKTSPSRPRARLPSVSAPPPKSASGSTATWSSPKALLRVP